MCFKALALKKKKKSEYHSERVIELQDVRVSMCVRGGEGGDSCILLFCLTACAAEPRHPLYFCSSVVTSSSFSLLPFTESSREAKSEEHRSKKGR